MRAGFFAPLPPARTGVADYAAALLAQLRCFGDVVPNAREADACLYHLGNNQIHHGIYRQAIEHPGVAVLHDAVLQHFFLGSLDEGAYVEEFVYNYGEWHRGLAREMWRRRAASLAAKYFEYPMLRRIAERSRAVVVHNPAAAEMVRRHAPAARIIEIPHLWQPEPAPPAAEVLRFRERLGIAPGAFVFGVFGYLRESKRLIPILQAYAELRRALPQAILMVAGDFVSQDLARAAAPLLAAPGVVRTPWLEPSAFRVAAAAGDACVNLRYPAAGETSGITVRLMGLAKPVILTTADENRRYPDSACLRVDPGPSEPAMLWHHMVLVARFPLLAREIGAHAAAHIAQHHDAGRAAELYWKTLCDYRS
ncbi:MAG TPA: hypothetical protein VN442_03525 [Bryobacteraceae bacterium]|nr:hypothetical protein [Bryobacteraceae bacterium]